MLTDDLMIVVGGQCEWRWKAERKRQAIERHEATIPDIKEVRKLERKAVSIAHGDVVEVAKVLYRRHRRDMGDRLDRIAHDMDAELKAHGGRYQSHPLKQPRGRRKRIVDEVIAWTREKYGVVISPRRVTDCWVLFRWIEADLERDDDRSGQV